MPSEAQLKGQRLRVVIFAPEDKSIKSAKVSRPGAQIASVLEEKVGEAAVEVVDRSLAKQLEKEIQLAEMKGNTDYQGPNIADYAITGKVGSATVTSAYKEGYTRQNQDGSTTTVAPGCDYDAQVSANLRIYQLPSLTFVKAISVEGRSGQTEDAASKNCKASASKQQKLMAKASEDAVYRVRDQFQNYFAPKAYVLERRENEGDNLFRISQGDILGFKDGIDVEIFRLEEDEYQEGRIVEYRVASGEITEAESKYAWVEINDSDKVNRLKRGHVVKPVYEIGGIESLFNKVKDASNLLKDMSGRTSSNTAGATGGQAGTGNTGPVTAGTVSPDAEVIEATWSTTANQHRGRLGQDFTYICPPNGTTRQVYGGLHNKYYVNSSVCTTAVYAGLMSVKTGGRVSIRIIDNSSGFSAGEKRNGVQPGATRYPRGFVFLR